MDVNMLPATITHKLKRNTKGNGNVIKIKMFFTFAIFWFEHAGKVDYADPPFLNRFEKQLLRFSDVLTDDQQEVVSSLKAWVHSFSTGTELPSQLDERDVFLGFHEDTLPSLVLKEGI